MDKKVIFAVAGAGKTTFAVEQLSLEKRSLIITYTDGNYDNIYRKILKKFNGIWPSNITLFTYFTFLYSFCYKPYFSDRFNAAGLTYLSNPDRYANQTKPDYYMTTSRFLYSNRLALLIEKSGAIDKLIARIERYFDELIIDEIQDIAGRDFNFLMHIMDAEIKMLFVGDFFQHTFDTSRDGNVNNHLFDDKSTYEKKFIEKGFICDNFTLDKSWRCGKEICQFISDNLNISISSKRTDDDGKVLFAESLREKESILNNESIIKLHYRNGKKYGYMHKNWGETKGEDYYKDVCVLLNKTTAKLMKANKLMELAPSTRNKLYVAITRARGNVYLFYE